MAASMPTVRLPVIPSEVEGSRGVILKLSHRDPSIRQLPDSG